ncbi:MAG: polysaccharide deacetylase family protein [Calditrichaeota bacterium]|nr:polysaccharide deacetylase family protein [Calditrichota bacterium]
MATGNNEPIILTFDDGPHPQWTPKLLNILSAHNIKAIFFMIGSNAAKNGGIVKDVIAEGHRIGNHTWSHKPLLALSKKSIFEEINKTHQFFLDCFSYKISCFRPPWGIIRKSHLELIESRFNYESVFWDVDSRDYFLPFPIRDKKKLKTKTIYLFHDGIKFSPVFSREHTLLSVERLIKIHTCK